MTCSRAAELLSEEAVEFAASFETAKPGTHFNLFYVKKGRKSYSVKYLTYKGFQEAVSYYNASEILAEGAVISWQLGGSFANENIVKIASDKYYKILYSTNKDDVTSPFFIENLTTGTKYEFGSTPVNRYAYLYVRDGQIVKVQYNVQDKNNKPTMLFRRQVINSQANYEDIEDITNLSALLCNQNMIGVAPSTYLNIAGQDQLKMSVLSDKESIISNDFGPLSIKSPNNCTGILPEAIS